jgi:hypothetical protein
MQGNMVVKPAGLSPLDEFSEPDGEFLGKGIYAYVFSTMKRSTYQLPILCPPNPTQRDDCRIIRKREREKEWKGGEGGEGLSSLQGCRHAPSVRHRKTVKLGSEHEKV